MSRVRMLAPAAALAALCALPGGVRAEPRTFEECVALAVKGSGTVAEAAGKVDEWRARLQEVESVWLPKITAVGYVAPLFGYDPNAFDASFSLKPGASYRQWDRWGPYVRLDALLVQPIYTFGQAIAGRKAAEERLAVEQARLDQARNGVALEVAQYYYLHLWIKSLTPTLAFAGKTLGEAEATAKEMYDAGDGKVTNVDLMKLRYAATELEKYRVQAEIGLPLSLQALRHTLGLPADSEVVPAEDVLPPLPAKELPALAELVKAAWERRPEAAQLRHGRAAAASLEEVERLAMAPVVAVAGQFSASWTPVRPDPTNPFLYDPYNDVSGGVALAMKWDFDPAKSAAKAAGARALEEQVDGLARFADTGIPLEVRKARDDVDQARRVAALSEEGAVATRKWLVFAAAAYASGTGETRDVLEGLAAFVGARKNQFDGLLAAHLAQAKLAWATGAIVPTGKPPAAGATP
jgi:outer membrane protein TolC